MVVRHRRDDQVVADSTKNVVSSQRHADTGVAIVALPLRLKPTEQLDVVARQLRGRIREVVVIDAHLTLVQQVLLHGAIPQRGLEAVVSIVLPLLALPGSTLAEALPLLCLADERDSQHLFGALPLKVCETSVEGSDLLHARDGQTHVAREQPHAEAVRRDGGVHAEPDRQQDVDERARQGHGVQGLCKGRGRSDPGQLCAFRVDQDAKLQN
mmetsp:Transcript_7389/g.27041  ORF Transcript_7389/g.27041 Transcript_7389/m.27041 type:complete len:212 (-) Transcript_7389:293-928(-)